MEDFANITAAITGVAALILAIVSLKQGKKINEIQKIALMMDRFPFFIITQRLNRNNTIIIEITNIGQDALNVWRASKDDAKCEIIMEGGRVDMGSTRVINITLKEPSVKQFSFTIAFNNKYSIESKQTLTVKDYDVKISRHHDYMID